MQRPETSNTKLILWSIVSILCSIISIGVFPPLFGGLAILFGYFARKHNHSVGVILMIVGAVALVAGFIIGAIWGMENLNF